MDFSKNPFINVKLLIKKLLFIFIKKIKIDYILFF